MGTTDLPEETLLGPSEGGTVLFLAGRVGSGDGKWGVQWCEVEGAEVGVGGGGWTLSSLGSGSFDSS